MSVYVDEMRSEISTAAPTPDRPAKDPSADPPWMAEERWREERDHAAWLAGRVCAVDFDD